MCYTVIVRAQRMQPDAGRALLWCTVYNVYMLFHTRNVHVRTFAPFWLAWRTVIKNKYLNIETHCWDVDAILSYRAPNEMKTRRKQVGLFLESNFRRLHKRTHHVKSDCRSKIITGVLHWYTDEFGFKCQYTNCYGSALSLAVLCCE